MTWGWGFLVNIAAVVVNAAFYADTGSSINLALIGFNSLVAVFCLMKVNNA
jgi:hypothetical protein